MKVDYHKLLKKYMAHVIDMEGWDFIENLGDAKSDQVFTGEEAKVLQKMSDDIYEETCSHEWLDITYKAVEKDMVNLICLECGKQLIYKAKKEGGDGISTC